MIMAKTVLEHDKDGRPLFAEDIVSDIHSKLERVRTDRRPYELQWEKNIRYYTGDQYCDIMTGVGEIAEIEPGWEWQERKVYNQINPIVNTRIANLKTVNSLMSAKACTSELDDYRKADITTKILRAIQMRDDFKDKRSKATQGMELTGTVGYLVWWNENDGDIFEEDDIIEIDAETGDVNTQKRYLRTGDVNYNLVNCWEMFPESLTKESIEEQRWIILEQVKHVDDIYDMYGIEVEGHSVEAFQLSLTNCGGDMEHSTSVLSYGHKTVDDSCKLITYMEKPNRRYPDGRLIILCDDEIIHYGDLPYDRIELIKMVSKADYGHFFGRSVIEDLMSDQDAYNVCVNAIVEYNKRINLGQMTVYEGSVDIDDLRDHGSEPGYIVEVQNGRPAPEYRNLPPFPNELHAELQRLKNDMEYIAGTSQLMVNGAAPSGVTSGTAIQSLMEIDNRRLALTGDNIRTADREWAKAVLRVYKKYSNVKRTLSITGVNNIGNTLYWDASDIGDFDIEFDTENELIVSEATRQENFKLAMQMGLFVDDKGMIPSNIKAKAREILNTGHYSDLMSSEDIDRQYAQNETVFFEQSNGRIVPEVSLYDNHSVHLDEHIKWTKQLNFMLLRQQRPEIADLWMQHIANHEQAQAQKMAQEVQATQMAMQGGAM